VPTTKQVVVGFEGQPGAKCDDGNCVVVGTQVKGDDTAMLTAPTTPGKYYISGNAFSEQIGTCASVEGDNLPTGKRIAVICVQ
jgi:hypothetical protein